MSDHAQMSDQEICRVLYEVSRQHGGVLKSVEFRVFVLLNIARALIDAAPNKDVLRETFSRIWNANEGPARAAKMDAQELVELKILIGPLQDVIQ